MDGARNEEDFVQQQELQQRARPPENRAEAHDHHNNHHNQPPPPPPRCPRCDSSNTKFCYYNNYSLSQPRYFCKACRRYWTQGGTLRNVPVGGGCRKSKRPRTLGPSSSNGLIRTPGLSTAAAQPQFPTAMMAGQSSRAAAPPMAPPVGGSFYGGGSFFSSLAAMQSSSAGGINHGGAMMGGGGGSRFGSNMALLQGMTFSSMKSPAPPQQQTAPPQQQTAPPSTHFFRPQQSLNPQGSFSSWTQSVINTGATSSSAAAPSGVWRSNGGAGSGQAGSSFAPNQWSDCNPGFNPSQ